MHNIKLKVKLTPYLIKPHHLQGSNHRIHLWESGCCTAVLDGVEKILCCHQKCTPINWLSSGVIILKITVFWNVILCSLECMHHCFKETSFQNQIRCVIIHLPDYMASYHQKEFSSHCHERPQFHIFLKQVGKYKHNFLVWKNLDS